MRYAGVVGAEGEGGCIRWSATEPGIGFGDWIWKTGGIGEDLQLAYLLPWPESLTIFMALLTLPSNKQREQP